MLARKVLLPPLLAGVVIVCALGALALTVTSGSRASDGKSPFAGDDGGELVTALSIELEGTPGAGDIRAARLPYDERRRLLERHPFYDLYVAAQQRYEVPWVLVASVHYQETGFGHRAKRGRSRRAVMSIARQLHRADAGGGLGSGAQRAVASRYGSRPAGDVSTAMVIERARAWRLLGTIPLPGRGELQTPVAGVVGGCGYFGCPRPGHLHNGVDYLAPSGTPIHAVDAGRVVVVETPGESGGYGNFTCVQHRPHLASCYAHQSAFAAGIEVGARVKRGEVIGLVGSTGSSTAPHLHFEVRRGQATCQSCAVDPLPLLSGDVPEASVPKMLRVPDAARRTPAPAAASASSPAPDLARAPAAQPAPAPDPVTPPATSTSPAEKPSRPDSAAQPAVPNGAAGPSGDDHDSRDPVPSFDPAPSSGPSPGGRSPSAAPPRPAAPAPAPPAATPGSGGASSPAPPKGRTAP